MSWASKGGRFLKWAWERRVLGEKELALKQRSLGGAMFIC